MPRINRKGKQNGSRSKTISEQTYRVYCPQCPIPNMVHPEEAPHYDLSGKVLVCAAGHVSAVYPYHLRHVRPSAETA